MMDPLVDAFISRDLDSAILKREVSVQILQVSNTSGFFRLSYYVGSPNQAQRPNQVEQTR